MKCSGICGQFIEGKIKLQKTKIEKKNYYVCRFLKTLLFAKREYYQLKKDSNRVDVTAS